MGDAVVEALPPLKLLAGLPWRFLSPQLAGAALPVAALVDGVCSRVGNSDIPWLHAMRTAARDLLARLVASLVEAVEDSDRHGAAAAAAIAALSLLTAGETDSCLHGIVSTLLAVDESDSFASSSEMVDATAAMLCHIVGCSMSKVSGRSGGAQ